MMKLVDRSTDKARSWKRWSDEEEVDAIREVLEQSPLLSEGHRKVRARLRKKGMRVGKNRVLRPMREKRLSRSTATLGPAIVLSDIRRV